MKAVQPHKNVVKKILRPIERFMELETSSGIILLLTTVVALTWANSPWADSYEHLIHLPIGISFGGEQLIHSLHYWVNDALMVIFFFIVGLEIKRELLVGELSTPKKAALPMFAALGGMVFPAIFYYYFNAGKLGASGWGIPMATDIAFAVGILTLMGRKVPFALKVFLLALAIVDDLGAVLIIAFFYTEEIIPHALGFATIGLALTYIFRYIGVRRHIPYIILGVFVWFWIFKSGVHATVAGVLIGLLTPIEPLYALAKLPDKFRDMVNKLSKEIEKGNADNKVCLNNEAKAQLGELFHYTVEAQNPLERSIKVLHPWVSFLIMPLFALVNAGVSLKGVEFSSILASDISIGVFIGLLLGKPIGVTLLSYIAVKSKMADLPRGVTWYHILSLGFLAGIGFTMALFISNLALKVPEVEVFSKMGILLASACAGIIGSAMLALTKDQPKNND